MMTDIGIREIDRDSRAGTKLGLAKRVETEEMLEDVLEANPNMLMRVRLGMGRLGLIGLEQGRNATP